jgi:hypothetical protein
VMKKKLKPNLRIPAAILVIVRTWLMRDSHMLSPYGEWKEHGNCELLIDCWKMEDQNGSQCKVFYTLFNFNLNQSLSLI